MGIKQPNKMSRDRALKLVVNLPNIRKNLSKKGGFLSGNPVGRGEVNFPGQIKIDFAQHFSVLNLAARCIWAITLHSDFSWDIFCRCWAKNSKKNFVCLFSQTFAYFLFSREFFFGTFFYFWDFPYPQVIPSLFLGENTKIDFGRVALRQRFNTMR
jgi:hypothetical protein